MAKYQSRRRKPPGHLAKPHKRVEVAKARLPSPHPLSWYRWEWTDPYHPDFWTACTVSIYAPTYERPYVSVLGSIANGHGRVLMRCPTLQEAYSRVGVPEVGRERLELAYTKAQGLLAEVHRDLRLIMGAKGLEPGSVVIRTDTGAIVAEAEQILKVTIPLL